MRRFVGMKGSIFCGTLLAAFCSALLSAVFPTIVADHVHAQGLRGTCGFWPCASKNATCESDPDLKPGKAGEVGISVCNYGATECYLAGRHYCKPPSDAELAERARNQAESDRKAKEIAEKKARYDADLAAETARLGAHRAAEAKRFVDLRQKAAELSRSSNADDVQSNENCDVPAYEEERFISANTGYEAVAAHAALKSGTICSGKFAGSIGPLQCQKTGVAIFDTINSSAFCKYTVRCPPQKSVCRSTSAIKK